MRVISSRTHHQLHHSPPLRDRKGRRAESPIHPPSLEIPISQKTSATFAGPRTRNFLALGETSLINMGIYLSTPKTDKFSEDGENNKLKFGLSSMQGWRASMEDAHSALLNLDNETSFFGVFDGHGGRVVAKFCAKYLHSQVLRSEAYSAGDLGTAVHRAFFRMDEMMRGQRGWRELSALGDKINKIGGMIEGLIWSPRGSDSNKGHDDWSFEEVFMQHKCINKLISPKTSYYLTSYSIIRDLTPILLGQHADAQHAYNLSRDHKPELEAERERILKAGGFIHMGRINGSLNLTRAIGDMEFKQNKFLPPEKQIVTANPDINVVELCDDDDFLVLACDGIWDCMSSQQLVDFIHEHIQKESSLSAVCERVLDRCLAPSTIGGEGCDNMTMVLVQFKKPITQNKKADVGEQSAKGVEEAEIKPSGEAVTCRAAVLVW
uniref:protein-serine/threonine phosphatase n=1 Tax=Oryza punctata TaxID=4537 RepID=A0A0E0JWE2_ORYPU